MTRCVIYVRVSSDEQVKGMSLDFQKQDCLEYVRRKGIEVDRIFEEKGESAKFADRPALIELLDYCRKHTGRIQALVIWKLDRLSRNQLDYYYLKRILRDLGIDLFSATEPTLGDESSIAGKIFETFSALQAEIDNTIRSERARRGIEAKVASGINPWSPPPGYQRDPNRRYGDKKMTPDVPDPVLFPIIQSALKEYATGTLTQADLTRLLNENGYAKIRGRRIYPRRSTACSTAIFNTIAVILSAAGPPNRSKGNMSR
jgi:DNA invertase Pin-like site-specific DNA recombinase